MKKYYKSCFIVDVAIEEGTVILTDSSKNRYFMDIKVTEKVVNFKDWFRHVFIKGIAQTLTIFEYTSIDISECETEIHIVKFLNKTDEELLK